MKIVRYSSAALFCAALVLNAHAMDQELPPTQVVSSQSADDGADLASSAVAVGRVATPELDPVAVVWASLRASAVAKGLDAARLPADEAAWHVAVLRVLCDVSAAQASLAVLATHLGLVDETADPVASLRVWLENPERVNVQAVSYEDLEALVAALS